MLETIPFDFTDPIDMLLAVDDMLLRDRENGGMDLYPWQMQIMKDFAQESSFEQPYNAVLRSNNGAGKDQMIIAPCATWLCSRYPYAQAVITSKSGPQLDKQTNVRIQQICESFNAKYGEVWKINYRHYENL